MCDKTFSRIRKGREGGRAGEEGWKGRKEGRKEISQKRELKILKLVSSKGNRKLLERNTNSQGPLEPKSQVFL